jgi:hypothetical protein
MFHSLIVTGPDCAGMDCAGLYSVGLDQNTAYCNNLVTVKFSAHTVAIRSFVVIWC